MKIEIGPYEEERKVDIQLDPYDTWSLDHTLALIIVPLLKQLRDTNHGYPANLTDEKWIEIQNKMIWSFEQVINQDDTATNFSSGEVDISFEPLPNGFSRLVEGPNHTYEFDRDRYKEHDKKIQEGLDLFAKYFRNLWD